MKKVAIISEIFLIFDYQGRVSRAYNNSVTGNRQTRVYSSFFLLDSSCLLGY